MALISKLVTKRVEFGLLHKRLSYIGKEQILLICKEAGISVNPASIINFYYLAYLLLKAP